MLLCNWYCCDGLRQNKQKATIKLWQTTAVNSH